MSDFIDTLRKRDADRRRDCRDLISRYEQDQRELYRMAEAEGWASILRLTVINAAGMIAKRNESRSRGLAPNNPPTTVHGAPLDNVRCSGDQDWIVIRQEDVSTWRKWAGVQAKEVAA